MDARNKMFDHLKNVILPEAISITNRKAVSGPSGSSVGDCSNFDRIHEQDAEEESS